MRWTQEKIAELREWSFLSANELGARLGVKPQQVYSKAFALDLRIGRQSPLRSDAYLRSRWWEMLPRMKAALVADILRDAP